MNLEAQLEAILFYSGEPMTYSALAKICETEESAVRAALHTLEATLQGRGIVLIQEGDRASLMTAPSFSTLIEKMRKEELRRDIGKAGAETLAIIAYHGTITRPEIDFIRGVNSTFILRNLMVRGLIERAENPKDQRSFAYRPTRELYAHLGITKKEDLPHYGEMMEEIATYRKEQTESAASQESTS